MLFTAYYAINTETLLYFTLLAVCVRACVCVWGGGGGKERRGVQRGEGTTSFNIDAVDFLPSKYERSADSSHNPHGSICLQIRQGYEFNLRLVIRKNMYLSVSISLFSAPALVSGTAQTPLNYWIFKIGFEITAIRRIAFQFPPFVRP